MSKIQWTRKQAVMAATMLLQVTTSTLSAITVYVVFSANASPEKTTCGYGVRHRASEASGFSPRPCAIIIAAYVLSQSTMYLKPKTRTIELALVFVILL